MARYDDLSPHPERWTNAKLMREARKLTNYEGFDGDMDLDLIKPWSGTTVDRKMNRCGDAVRAATELYRQSWVTPVLDEIERRFVKAKA